ncbi:MAG TPA: DUF1206 domain-containing protein [Thermoanaerobaculia bacterium]
MRGALIRLGLAATGLVYAAMGVVSARVAFLGARDREQGVPGALRFLLEQPQGPRLLGAVVVGLVGVALVHGVECVTGRRSLASRAGLFVNAIGYAALAWTSARLLLHLGRGGGLEREGIAWLLGAPFGTAVLEAIGAAVIAGGLWEAWQGLRGRLNLARRLPRRLGRILSAISRFGLIARGIVLCALGYFLIRAAAEADPDRAQTLGGVLRGFTHTAFGPVFVGVVALGLAAYGVHLWTFALLKRKV